MLTAANVRTLLAVAGAGLAVLLMFLQLGFFGSVLFGATEIYDKLDFDLVLLSPDYTYLARARTIPRRRLVQAQALPEVEQAAPFYVGFQHWVDGSKRTRRAIFVMGFRLRDRVFRSPEIDRLRSVLQQPDTAAVDRKTRPIYGPQRVGRIVEVGGRDTELVGQYDVGTGFIELGTIVVSDQNFVRISAGRSLDDVSIGLVTITPNASADQVARQLRQSMPADVQVLTRDALYDREQRYWAVNTSTGMILGFGVIVAFVVGMVILYQMLSTQIIHQLPELATMKAIGYSDGYLAHLILVQGVLLAAMGFLPGLGCALVLYKIVGEIVRVPISMTTARVIIVFGLSVGMSVVASLLSLRKLRLADPADLI